MTGLVSEPPATRRWHALLAATGSARAGRLLRGGPPGSTVMQCDVRELLIRIEPAIRRETDFVLTALLERVDGAPDLLVVAGPDAIRARSRPGTAGVVVTELDLVPPVSDAGALSLMLLQVPRRPRLRDLVGSLEALAGLIDLERDPSGSLAATDAAVRRLEVLACSDGVSVALAGSIEAAAGHLLLAAEGAGASPAELRDGRLVRPGADEEAVPWREANFALIRFGPPRAATDARRTIDDLRRESAGLEALVEVTASVVEESYGVRVTRGRQTSRAEQIVSAARTGDSTTAADEYRAGLAQPGATGPLLESLVERVVAVEDFWRVSDVLRAVEAERDAAPSLLQTARQLRLRFEPRLGDVVRAVPGSEDQEMFAVTTPIRLELGSNLVPLVDDKLDGGSFLYTLVPRMKERVKADMGIDLPGIRGRPNPALEENAFSLQIDEVVAHQGVVEPAGHYALTAVGAVPPPDADLCEFHPLDGGRGLWRLSPGPDAGLDRAQYLLNRVERVLRRRLARFATADAVQTLVSAWRDTGDGERVKAVLPDQRSTLRLTWVIQGLLDDGVPVADWESVVGAIADAGGIESPLLEVRRAVRARLRAALPGPAPGMHVAVVPDELATAELGRSRIALVHWLGQLVATEGPAVSIVAATDHAREAVAAVARTVSPLITTFSLAEAAAHDG